VNISKSKVFVFFASKDGMTQALTTINLLLSNQKESCVLFMFESSETYSSSIKYQLKKISTLYFNRLLIQQTSDYEKSEKNLFKKMGYNFFNVRLSFFKGVEYFMKDYEQYADGAEFKFFVSKSDKEYIKEFTVKKH
jgi:hypothetical protein